MEGALAAADHPVLPDSDGPQPARAQSPGKSSGGRGRPDAGSPGQSQGRPGAEPRGSFLGLGDQTVFASGLGHGSSSSPNHAQAASAVGYEQEAGVRLGRGHAYTRGQSQGAGYAVPVNWIDRAVRLWGGDRPDSDRLSESVRS